NTSSCPSPNPSVWLIATCAGAMATRIVSPTSERESTTHRRHIFSSKFSSYWLIALEALRNRQPTESTRQRKPANRRRGERIAWVDHLSNCLHTQRTTWQSQRRLTECGRIRMAADSQIEADGNAEAT